MKIAQICPYDLDRPGGVQLHIRDTAAALRDLGHDVTLIAPRVDRSAASDDATMDAHVVEVGGSARIRFGGTAFEVSIALSSERRRLAELMGGAGFDVVHYHTVWTPFLPLQALASSRDAAVMTFHDTPPDTLLGDAGRLAQRGASRLLSPRIDGAIAVSDASRQHIAAKASQHMVILPPCTDLRRFLDAPAAAARPDGKLNILFVGRLEPRKGVMVLLQAFQRLRATRADVRLTIAGGGSEEARLKQYAAGVPDVAFLGRFPADTAPALYADCDIFCAPSLYGESFGIVLAEAMASGKPVVAAANRGYRTVLGETGVHCLSRPGDVDSLHRRLTALTADAELRRRLGAWGQAQARRYDCRTVAPRLVDVYEEAIIRRRSRLAARRPAPAPAWTGQTMAGPAADLG